MLKAKLDKVLHWKNVSFLTVENTIQPKDNEKARNSSNV